jgi:ABC-type multidrug transport system ATPase subunit
LLLNAKELLQFYGGLRGMTPSETKWVSEALINYLGLSKYTNQRCYTYSAGKRRTLSAAIGLVGDPDLIFLDEPSRGLDPGARRQLWKLLLLLIRNQKSILLTTHSMEECETLCTRVGIMVDGKFECLGSTQHLKNRFGAGYVLTVRCCESQEEDFFRLMEERMPYAELDQTLCSQYRFTVSQENAKLSDIFDIMLSAEDSGLIEQYSVSQTTLDDIFVKFASHQKDG